MQSLQDFQSGYGQIPPLEIDQLLRSKKWRKTKVNLKGNLTLTSIRQKKLACSNGSHEMITDLYHLISSFVGGIRGQSGILEPTEALTFKLVKKVDRGSYGKCLMDMMTIDRGLGQGQNTKAIEEVGSLKEAEVFVRFIRDLEKMLEQRSLYIPVDQVPLLRNDQGIKFWLSNTCLRSENDKVSENFSTVSNLSKKSKNALVLLISRDQRARVLIKSVKDLVQEGSTLKHRNLPHKRFQTRSSRTKMLTKLFQDYQKAIGLFLFHFSTQWMNISRSTFFQTMRRMEWRLVPENWPIKQFLFSPRNLRHIDSIIPLMMEPKVRIKIYLECAGLNEDINLCVTEFVKPLVKVCLLYTSPSPRDRQKSRMPSSA
eukprot:TRINITY_DN17574_c0_g1_i2.p1 TRINITY_DN17574_c0_g1~~TRINITY_DN17574_c0_g1_i2.p1  ORF type:complete len:371 (+),score=31.39 TRINITY_DN17574_c0_g1_i2:40-1152(+)